MNLTDVKPIIYTAQSKNLFYARMLICKFVIEHDAVPLNPFNVWGYFLYDLVDRDLVRRGNNNIVRIADEVWVFGPVADGVLAEIDLAIQYGKPLRFFSAGSKVSSIKPIAIQEIEFESDAIITRSEGEIRDQLANYRNLTKGS